MEIESIKVYKDLTGSCHRLNENNESPGVKTGTVYKGVCRTMPQVGLRFNCATLSTNIVARIVDVSNKEIMFETISGSLYKFIIKTRGSIETEFEYPGNKEGMINVINEYLNKNHEN